MSQTIGNRLRCVAQTVVKRIKQMTRPANGLNTSNLIIDLTRSKNDLLVENALFRQQLVVLRRHQKRPKLSNWDRIKLICLARLTPNWKGALHIVQPDTVPAQHRVSFGSSGVESHDLGAASVESPKRRSISSGKWHPKI